MPKPIPDNIKEILGQLSGQQQVAIRSYIGTLRAEIKELEAEVLAKSDPDPHAHYHGHEKVSNTEKFSRSRDGYPVKNSEILPSLLRDYASS